MILDTSLVLSDAQGITASAASTNVIDLGPTGTPFGANAPSGATLAGAATSTLPSACARRSPPSPA
jgi:hypothetical protein